MYICERLQKSLRDIYIRIGDGEEFQFNQHLKQNLSNSPTKAALQLNASNFEQEYVEVENPRSVPSDYNFCILHLAACKISNILCVLSKPCIRSGLFHHILSLRLASSSNELLTLHTHKTTLLHAMQLIQYKLRSHASEFTIIIFSASCTKGCLTRIGAE